MVFKKHEFSATIILKRIIFEMAFYSDRFKKLILFSVGVIKYSRGLRREARAYWMFAGSGQYKAKITTEVDSEYNEDFYVRLEDEDYKDYVESAKTLVLSTYPEKTDEICDIGCGRGFLVKALQEEGYTKAIGIEISRYAIEHKVTDYVYLKNIYEFEENQFKVVSIVDVLEHLQKGEIQNFLKEVARITEDYIVCSIPVYPNNLFDFFHEPDHRTFERREWWDEEFRKAGFCPWVLPKEPLPSILPFVYRKIKGKKKLKKVSQTKTFSQIHFAIDLSLSNAFTWVTVKLALALDSLGYRVSINPASLCNTIAVEDRIRLEQLMEETPGKEVQIKWSHYWKPYLEQKINGDLNLEIYNIDYLFNGNDKKEYDYWVKSMLNNNYYKLPNSTFSRDVMATAGISKDRSFILPHGFSPEIKEIREKIDLPTNKSFKFLAITNAYDPNRYGNDILMKAFTKAFSREDDVALVIVDYGGKDPNIEKAIRQYRGNLEIIYITQFLPKDVLIKFYNSCDAFVAPFRGEGFSMKILDAMACGLPTILPLFSGPTEYANAQNCFPVQFEIIPMEDSLDTRSLHIGNSPHWCEVNVDSLIDTMRYVYNNTEEARKIAFKGKEFVLSEFSWEHIAKRLINIIDNIRSK